MSCAACQLIKGEGQRLVCIHNCESESHARGFTIYEVNYFCYRLEFIYDQV